MPSYGEYQKPAGVLKPCGCGHLGTRFVVSNNTNIIPTLKKIDNVPYKGNAVLNAQK